MVSRSMQDTGIKTQSTFTIREKPDGESKPVL